MTLGAKNSTPAVGVAPSVSPDVAVGVVPASVGNVGILHISVAQHVVEQVILAPPPSIIILSHTVLLNSEQLVLGV